MEGQQDSTTLKDLSVDVRYIQRHKNQHIPPNRWYSKFVEVKEGEARGRDREELRRKQGVVKKEGFSYQRMAHPENGD